MRLAKAGYMGGDPGNVYRAPVDMVMAMIHWENFTSDYERAWIDLNREDRT